MIVNISQFRFFKCEKSVIKHKVTCLINKLIDLQGFINAFEHHCANLYETATFLGVTEQFLADTINAYMHKYGCYIKYKNYVIEFGFNSVNVIKQYN